MVRLPMRASDIILRSEVNGTSARRSKRLICVVVPVELARGDEKRRLGRVALDAPLPVVLGELRVVGERTCDKHQLGLASGVRR